MVKAVFSYVIYINIASTVSNTAPGMPNVPTTSDVITFIPICNPHIVPTMLITYNNTAPKNEFIINLVIIFIGIINIFLYPCEEAQSFEQINRPILAQQIAHELAIHSQKSGNE